MFASRTLLILVLAIATSSSMAQVPSAGSATKYLALVMGNTAYKGQTLPGPANDATDVAIALRGIGFRVTNSSALADLGRDRMYSLIQEFLNEVDSNTVAVVYYSGHGLEDQNKNYLVPVDAVVKTFGDIQSQLVSLDAILIRLSQREARTKIVILDACRNMPLALRHKDLGEKGGLAAVKDLGPGTRLIYATSPDTVAIGAAEGQRNSVFTGALLRAIKEQPPTFDDVLNRAAVLTLLATDRRQSPWSAGTLGISSFKVGPQMAINPFEQSSRQQPSSEIRPNKSPAPSAGCQEITEQLIVNGVVTWKKTCI